MKITTMDFLWHGWQQGMFTTDEANGFIEEVRAKGSKIPNIRIEQYVCEHFI